MKREAPAESYGLIMSSYGGGWVPADLYDVYLLGEGSRATTPTARPLFYGQDDKDVVVHSGYTDTFFTVTGDSEAYIAIEHYSGLSCYILQDECPNTAAAWRNTAWASATTTK